jgi:2-desacetyl-2-hydroxyethyl bacteriochlorophyllide A dehydrogenase
MPAEMRAACLSPQREGRHAFEVRRIPVPEPGPGEVRVAVEACGICGSDLHLLGSGFFAPGATPGHEAAGVVDALGADVAGWRTGARVAVEPMRGCGRCAECRRGSYSICRAARLHGVHLPGGLAEFVVVPADRVHAVPADLDMSLAALAEPMAVVVHALARGGLARGARVLVLGAGSVGLLTLAAARRLGAGEVWITARHPHQAELARSLGAARVLGEAEADATALDRIGRDAPIDLVVETVGGRADTLAGAVAAARPGGVVSVVGLFLGPVTLEPWAPMMKELTLAWSYCYGSTGTGADFARAIEVIAAERDALAPLVTHRFALDEVGRAFEIAGDRRGGAVKISIRP